jgi:hypothetical protein
MRSALVLSGLFAFASAQSSTITPAAVVTNNPIGVQYKATLPKIPNSNILGSVVAQAVPNAVGVSFTIQVSGFPSSGGPFCKCMADMKSPGPQDPQG